MPAFVGVGSLKHPKHRLWVGSEMPALRNTGLWHPGTWVAEVLVSGRVLVLLPEPLDLPWGCSALLAES